MFYQLRLFCLSLLILSLTACAEWQQWLAQHSYSDNAVSTEQNPIFAETPTGTPIVREAENSQACLIPKTKIALRKKVMRIWIASWQDRQGDLNVPSYIYTEVEPKQWLIGKKTKNTSAK